MPKIIKPAKGSFTTADVTIDSSGRVIAAASGSSGGGGFVPQLIKLGPASGTYAPPADVTKYYAYAASGGGGAGLATGPSLAGSGGAGAYGFYKGDVTGGTPLSYAVGGGGGQASAGGATNVTNLFTVNGGSGGNNATNNAQGNPGPSGSAPGAAFTVDRDFLYGNTQNLAGPGPRSNVTNPAPNRTGPPGGRGALTFFDNES